MPNPNQYTTIKSGNRVIIFQHCAGFSAEQVVALLNWREADVRNGEIVHFAEVGDGHTPIAVVVFDNDDLSGGDWIVQPR